ncbi:hypothetical protein [Ligilactobacillus acidipiscis]|uniref:hypothetical protein n=1 Tax=Ligilactobacillus acidipiscis TaxID=89059 RepID=UPI0023F8492B|nr:hypothetical protein [Ligilactobacillus acidipiscis]WEV56409.1 hypothetical protein OZX66_09275 [Ligilactobacillus acidipiscis]
MDKRILKANYEETSKLVTEKNLNLTEDTFKNIKFRSKFSSFLVALLLFGPLMYFIGVGLPQEIGDEKSKVAFYLSSYGTFFIPVIKITLVIWLVVFIAFLFPRKNYAVNIRDALVVMMPMFVASILIFFDLLFALSVAGIGLEATCILIVVGIFYILVATYNVLIKIKNTLYDLNLKKISFKWNVYVTIIGLVGATVIALLFQTIKNGFLIYSASFSILVVFIFAALMIKVFVHSSFVNHYFVKYADQYQEKFKITDEQWYGHNKVK